MTYMSRKSAIRFFTFYYKKSVLSQGEPRDAAVNSDTYRILQRHRAVSLPQHDFLVCRLQTMLAFANNSTRLTPLPPRISACALHVFYRN